VQERNSPRRVIPQQFWSIDGLQLGVSERRASGTAAGEVQLRLRPRGNSSCERALHCSTTNHGGFRCCMSNSRHYKGCSTHLQGSCSLRAINHPQLIVYGFEVEWTLTVTEIDS
jgi:hypothetical protein